ncbi:tripartite tricarboxylate transporter TctB family protein [Rhizobium puerariae]|uniref:Tripartite tricarboxylate transporter TctB family protein n=1 Tax=Rhizobium puerariae TaxID=1585791 RepID=A0ABV6AIS4_9HYPH
MSNFSISAPRHLVAGLLYIAVGAIALMIARTYPLGTSSAMGAGYFPVLISVLLIGVGIIAVIASFLTQGQAIEAIAWRPVIMITLSVIAFGLLVEPIGLALALVVVLHIAALASPEFRFSWRATAGTVALSAICCLVFVTLLGVPMPIAGEWLLP